MTEIHFEIENKCMLNCKHCSSEASLDGNVYKYSVNDMINFLSKINGEKKVFLTGGEPLLHPDFEHILFQITNSISDISLGIFTTGLVIKDGRIFSISKEKAESYFQNGLSSCYVSLYSTSDEVHNWITQKDSFEYTVKSIENLKSAGIDVKLNVVIHQKNITEINKIISFAETKEISEIRLLKLINHGRATNNWNELEVSDDEYRDVVNKIMNIKTKINITASGLIDIYPCRPEQKTLGCEAGKQLFYITVTGKIFPCASVKNRDSYCITEISNVNWSKIEEYREKKHIAFCSNLK